MQSESDNTIADMQSPNIENIDYHTPPKQFGGGTDLQFTTDTWDKLAVSQSRLEMLRILVKSDIGLNEVEEYNESLNLKIKSKALRTRGPLSNREVVRVAMRGKVKDEMLVLGECTRERDNVRRRIKSIFGPKSGKT